MRRHIKEAGKTVVKKFAKAVKQQDTKVEKTGSINSRTKKAAPVTMKTPAKKRTAIKKIPS